MRVRLDTDLKKIGHQEVELVRFPATIGRSLDCMLRITSRLVSRRHCELCEHDGWLMVNDLRSSNGTWINGERIDQPTVVRPGDVLEVGPVRFNVLYEAPCDSRVEQNGDGEANGSAAATLELAAASFKDAIQTDDPISPGAETLAVDALENLRKEPLTKPATADTFDFDDAEAIPLAGDVSPASGLGDPSGDSAAPVVLDTFEPARSPQDSTSLASDDDDEGMLVLEPADSELDDLFVDAPNAEDRDETKDVFAESSPSGDDDFDIDALFSDDKPKKPAAPREGKTRSSDPDDDVLPFLELDDPS